MDTQKFTMGIVGLVVIILMITAAVLPAVENAQSDQHKTENNSSARYMAIQSNTDTVFAIADSTPTINDVKISEIIDAPESGAFQVWVMSDQWILRTQSENGVWNDYWFLYYENNSNQGARMSINATTSLVCSGGVADVMVSDESTLELAYTYLMIPSSTGNYVEYSKDVSNVYVDSGKTIYIGSASSSTTWTSAHGTIDSITVDKNFVSGPAAAATITVNYTETEYGASNELISITGDGVTIGNTTCVFVPLEYTVITEQGGTIISLFGMIPLLLIICAVLFAVRLMGTSRN